MTWGIISIEKLEAVVVGVPFFSKAQTEVNFIGFSLFWTETLVPQIVDAGFGQRTEKELGLHSSR
jgi:hypothetical protein